MFSKKDLQTDYFVLFAQTLSGSSKNARRVLIVISLLIQNALNMLPECAPI
jgi:hypothetical protein